MPFIHSISTALPEHTVTSEEAEAHLTSLFAATGEDPALIQQIFGNCGVERRGLARPASFYLEQRDFTARSQAYAEVTRELGVAAARDALSAAKIQPAEVDLVIDTSCTGVMIPALDVFVANALGFRRDVRRMPLTEAGCAAGATSLAFASEILADHPNRVALLLSVELPSLTLQLQDTSRANLISSAIFGDGASGVVLSNREPSGPSIAYLAHKTVLFPETTDIMGFDLGSSGFKIILSRRIPLLVRKHLRSEVDAFLEAQGLHLDGIGFHVIHPGGAKVLDNVSDVLDLSEEQVASSRRVLRDYGNLSSASVHFVTKDLLEQGKIEPGAYGLLVAMGPGFTLELALLRGVDG